jgi:hypothetical protein
LWGATLVALLTATQVTKGSVMNSRTGDSKKMHGYAPVNGLKMYYEIEGTGEPLVFIPPAFGFAGLKSFPALAQNHSVITVDLQGNGRTADIPDRPISIEQYAEDVVGLLKYLGISRADFLGESYGGNTAAVIRSPLSRAGSTCGHLLSNFCSSSGHPKPRDHAP